MITLDVYYNIEDTKILFKLGNYVMAQGDYLDMTDAKMGMKVKLDKGFTCMSCGVHMVMEDKEGLFLKCRDGKHYIDGQCNDEGKLIGIYPMTEKTATINKVRLPE